MKVVSGTVPMLKIVLSEVGTEGAHTTGSVCDNNKVEWPIRSLAQLKDLLLVLKHHRSCR